MTISQDKIIVVDVEATCWRKEPPPGEINEIIEVGICVLNLTTMQPVNKRGILVKPERSKVSAFCTRLTTITPEMVSTGVSFAEACATLEQEYDTKNYLWSSWGNYDLRIFAAQCALFGVSYPFSDHHMNIKALFASTNQLPKQVGLMRSIKMIGYEPQGTQHRGVDDAWNTAHVLAHLLNNHGRQILDPFWQD